jgi:hypothetical protein
MNVSRTCQQSSPAVDWQWKCLLIVLVPPPDETRYLLSTRHAHLQQSIWKDTVKRQVEYVQGQTAKRKVYMYTLLLYLQMFASDVFPKQSCNT